MPTKYRTRILIVDDLKSAATSLRETLIHRGFAPENLQQAYSIDEARTVLKQTLGQPSHQFDLVITDLKMADDLEAGFKLVDFITRKVRPKYRRGSERRGLYPKIFIYSVFGSKYVPDQLRPRLDAYKHAGAIEDHYTKEKPAPGTGLSLSHSKFANRIEQWVLEDQGHR